MDALAPVRETRWFVERDSAAWHAAWRSLGFALAERGIGTGFDLAQEHDGEVWQYLVSGRAEGRSYVVHEFRHRFHPITERREYLRTVCPS